MGAEDALQGRRSPMRGAFGQDIDLVGALGAVFAKWLPDDFVDMNALQPLLDKYDATRRLPEPPRAARAAARRAAAVVRRPVPDAQFVGVVAE